MANPIIFPVPTSVGQVFKAPTNINYQWDGYKWSTRLQSRNSSLGGNPGPIPPIGAVVGDFWFNTDNGQLYIFIDMGTGVPVWEKTSTLNVKFMGDKKAFFQAFGEKKIIFDSLKSGQYVLVDQ